MVSENDDLTDTSFEIGLDSNNMLETATLFPVTESNAPSLASTTANNLITNTENQENTHDDTLDCNPKHNLKFLQSFEKELMELRKKRLGIMNNFGLFVSHVHGEQTVLNSKNSADLCSLLVEYKNLDVKIYFSPIHSQLTPEERLIDTCIKPSPKQILLRSIKQSGKDGGDVLISNGMTCANNNKHWVMNICCSCHRLTQSNKMNAFTDYRADTYSNNCKNNRKGAVVKHSRIRRSAQLSKNKDMLCPFYLTIYEDENGFYVKSKSCNPYHENHPKRNHLCTPKSLIHADELQNLKDTRDAAALAGTGRNIYYVRSKRRKKFLIYYHHVKFQKYAKD